MRTEPDDVLIRPALHADIAGIQYVASLSWATAYEGIIPPEVQSRAIANWYSDDSLAMAIGARESLFLLAERSNAVIGFVNLYCTALGVVHLARIYLLPKEQRKGLGARLINAALELVPDGAEIVTVDVEERNYQARSFYERCGFVAVAATTTDIFGFHLPLVRYEMKLEHDAA
ncbi:MAG TPA: GNAT family N-acetyltransferase [Thermoanaerobaculia bacterium]|nr:GNAT family N-acetyltransferase [Thermoanaerobaculia bacterium]